MNEPKLKKKDTLKDEETMKLTISIYKDRNFVNPKKNLFELNQKIQKILQVPITLERIKAKH